MPKTIPMIRAVTIGPLLDWCQENNRPLADWLAEADLAYVNFDEAMRPIPLRNAAEFVRILTREEGPDICSRAISAPSLFRIALIGQLVAASRNPRDALIRISAAMPYQCSHEHIRLSARNGGLAVIEGWSVDFDQDLLHSIQQIVVCLVDGLCSLTDAPQPVLSRIEMVPHPVHGLDHLRGLFGDRVVAAKTRALTCIIAEDVANRPFRAGMRMEGPLRLESLEPLTETPGFAGSSRQIMAAMLETGVPTVQRLAFSAGMSLRTYQRRLEEEGTSFSDLLESVRREVALARIAGGEGQLASVSATLGFSQQSALTRAVRRWTGQAPTALRKTRQRTA